MLNLSQGVKAGGGGATAALVACDACGVTDAVGG